MVTCFLKGLLHFLSQYSQAIANIAVALPTSIYLLEQYIGTPEMMSNMMKYVVCPNCHALHTYSDCFNRTGLGRSLKLTPKKCSQVQHRSPCGGTLLKSVITCHGNAKYYLNCVFCNFDFIFGLKSLLTRKGIIDMCESVRLQGSFSSDTLKDIKMAKLWKDFLQHDGQELLSAPYNYAVLLNVDWFQPFKNINYSVGVIYLALLKLPRKIRYKRENVIIVGIIPRPTEPSLNINTYLSPLVTNLKDLWDGVFLCDPHTHKTIKVRCVLLRVCCDLPAGWKVCGFLSYNTNKGCTRCFLFIFRRF